MNDEDRMNDVKNTEGSETFKPIDEEDYLDMLGMALQSLGYEPHLEEAEGYPISLRMTCPVSEDKGVEFTGIFLPLGALTGEYIQVLQLYFELVEDISAENFDMIEKLMNYCNGNTSVGTFGLQRNMNVIYCKHSITLRSAMPVKDSMTMVIDVFYLLDTMIKAFLKGIEAVAIDGMSVRDVLNDGIMPSNGRESDY